MTDNITRRQHYTPQFLLRQFATPRNNEHYIWFYDKKRDSIDNPNVKNVGVENWYYDKRVDVMKDRQNTIEGLLKILDGYHSQIYKIIQAKPIISFSENEKRIFAELVHLQATRTRRAKEKALKVNNSLLNNEHIRKAFQKEFPNTTIEEELEGIKRTIQLSNMFGVEIPFNKPKFSNKIKTILSYDMFLLINIKDNTGMEFYTSDHPVCLYELSQSRKGIKIAFPITPELCLMFTNDKEWIMTYPNQVAVVHREFIETTNEQTIINSRQFIFSRTNNFNFVRQFLSNQDERNKYEKEAILCKTHRTSKKRL